MDKYQHFKTEDFLEDEYFRQWIFHPDEETNVFWQHVIDSFPDQKVAITEAKDLLQSIGSFYSAKIQDVGQQKAQTSFRKLAARIDRKSKQKIARRKRLISWAVAASTLLLVGFGSLFFLQQEIPAHANIYQTSNGNRLSFQLPDGSKVQLNANSTLELDAEKWEKGNVREIWLDGEAFFEVEREGDGTKFIVNAGGMNIEVLGTQFNVRARDETAEVVLEEGKIELSIANEQKIEMQPGDYVSYERKQGKVQSKKVKAADYSAWKDGMAVFNNSLQEVARELEILYGIEFQIENETLRDRPIQLSAPSDSLELVLETLELLYSKEISIKRENDKITIY